MNKQPLQIEIHGTRIDGTWQVIITVYGPNGELHSKAITGPNFAVMASEIEAQRALLSDQIWTL